jgi:predicted DsbA family dithiol-disulfide isomerase
MSETQTIHIDIFTDYVCPWCYLCSAAVEKLSQNYPVEIQWKPFPLHPSTPDEGLSMEELFQGRNLDEMHERLYSMMDEAGLEHGERDKTYNSRLAQELAMWADTQDGGDAIHKALYQAYFIHNQNLAKHDVLLKIVESIGLDVEAAKQVLETRSFSTQVDESWNQARQFQVSGVPCFVSDNIMMSGCQPYTELERFVQHVQQKKTEELAPK